MTQTQPVTDRPTPPRPRGLHRSQAGKFAAVSVMILSLLATAIVQQFARSARTDLLGKSAAQSRVGNLDSFALSLVLGGLRGPLVMALWSSSESQKTSRELEDFDTKVELIRLLQPEFDSVHIFQIWNKAYNISAQRINLANKYVEILDALRYARSVDAERPNDINILMAEAMIYHDKLGTSQQKFYYRERVRTETKWRDMSREKKIDGAEQRPSKLDPLLDPDGYLTADAAARYPQLKPFQPFPYGVSTLALGYALFDQSRDLSIYEHQKHAQLTDLVIDSRPALALKSWYEEEQERARLAEGAAFGRKLINPSNDDQAYHSQLDELSSKDITLPVTMVDSTRAKKALYSYDLALRLAVESAKRMEDHSEKYKNMFDVYRSARDVMFANCLMMRADRAFLKATLDSSNAPSLLTESAADYEQSENHFRQVVLQYSVDDNVARACGYRREEVPMMNNAAALAHYMNAVQAFYAQAKKLGRMDFDPHQDDWDEYQASIARCNARLSAIQQYMGR